MVVVVVHWGAQLFGKTELAVVDVVTDLEMGRGTTKAFAKQANRTKNTTKVTDRLIVLYVVSDLV